MSVLLLGNRLGFPLPQALQLARAQFGQVLLLHVHTAKRGPECIVGDVLLLLCLEEARTNNKVL